MKTLRFDLAREREVFQNALVTTSRSITLPPRLLKKITSPVNVEITTETDSEQRRPMTPHLSHSQMSMFNRCGLQYKLRYIDGLKERPKVSMSIGKGGHAALDWNTKTKIRTGEDAPVEAVLQKASDMMDHYLRDLPESEYEKDVEPGSTKDKFIAATKIYRRRDAPAIKPVGAEVEFNIDLNQYLAEPLDVPIRIVNGKIDLLYDDMGTKVAQPEQIALGVEDYKYASRKKTQLEVDISPQLTLYDIVVQNLTGRWPTKAGFRVMHSGTVKDGPDSIVMTRNPELMAPDAMQRRLQRVIHTAANVEKAIRNEIFIPTDDPLICSWCGYRERCQESRVDDFTAAKLRALTTPTT